MTTEDKKSILLIDDDTSLLLTLSDFLKFEGYEVTTADSGEQGLKRLETLTPDLIILDMSMPGMGGVGFLKEISSAEGLPKHPVLVLTARANMAEFFADVDVDGFVSKPCDPNDLLMEVSRIIFLRRGNEDTAGHSKGTEKRKILLGEDDPVVSKILVSAFVDAGYVVTSVLKGPEILEKAIVERPDVVVVKLLMANMNGDAAAEMMSEMPNTRAIPVVLYDDTDTGGSESKYVKPGSPIKRFLHDNNSVNILSAIKEVLG